MSRFHQLFSVVLLSTLLITMSEVGAQTASPVQSGQLSLQSASTDVRTGQAYEVRIHVDNINELWLADLTIHYDPKLLYVIGTQAGSPVKPGPLWTPPDSTAVIQNSVAQDSLLYTVSLLAPASPVSGSGDVGSFRVYPLAPGTTDITFSKASLLKVNFATDDSGQRIGKASQPIPFTPVLLRLNITGQRVNPPQEPTETPVPSDTPTLEQTSAPGPTQETPTALVNVTAAPTVTPTPLSLNPIPIPQPPDNSLLLVVLIAVVVLALVGLIVVGVLWRRSRR